MRAIEKKWMNARRVIVRSERRWMRFWFFEQRWALCHNFHGEKISGGQQRLTDDSQEKRCTRDDNRHAEEPHIITPLLLRSSASSILFPPAGPRHHPYDPHPPCWHQQELRSQTHRRIVCATLRVESTLFAANGRQRHASYTRAGERNVRLSSRLCDRSLGTWKTEERWLVKPDSISLAVQQCTRAPCRSTISAPTREESPVSFPSRRDPPRGDSRVDLLSYPRAKPLLACPNKIVLVL